VNSHDHDDPMSLVSQLDATLEAVLTRCDHCTPDVRVIPASGTRHVLGVTHQAHCPEWVPE